MTVEAKTFDECVPKEIAHQKRTHPEFKEDQAVAVAYSKCRERFGIKEPKRKAEMLRMLETVSNEDDELLQTFIINLKKSFQREDWMDYGVILRKEGLTSEEVQKYLPYKTGWIKKYVNPIFNEVTQLEKLQVAENTIIPKELKKSILYASVTNLNKEKREFEGWGSVEVVDAHGDIILIKALEKIMPTYLARGGTITFGHSNQIVGKVLYYEIRNKRVNNNLVKGLWLRGKIFNNYTIDDLAWQSIKLSMTKNLPVLSLGATPKKEPTVECDETKCINKYEDGLELYEFTVTNMLRGSQGANPEAKIDLTKSQESGEEMEFNSQVVGKMLKAKKDGKLPADKNELVNFFLGTCSECQDKYQELLKVGKTETEAKKELLTELIKHMNDLSQEAQEVDDSTTSPEVQPEGETPELAKQDDMNLKEALIQIMSRLDQIESRLPAAEEPLEEATTLPTNTGPQTIPSADQSSVTLNKEDQAVSVTDLAQQMDESQFEQLAKSKGWVPSETSPNPTATTERRDLVKHQKKDLPESKDLLQALKSQDGSLNDLANKWRQESS